ncbi:MAG: hydrogenase maturation protease [Bacteroidales bacterium]|nr:hydrogenase maturation protease [Bacteroidales bacterium]
MTAKENNQKNSKPGILIYGYGNPGREDDGLGNAFVEAIRSWIEKNKLTNIELDSNYQLNIEDADMMAKKDIVLFVDATVEPIENFCVTTVEPSGAKVEFTMHSVSPAFVLDLCQKIFGKNPQTYLLHIKGYQWDFKEELSINGKKNLNKALEFIKPLLSNPDSFLLIKDDIVPNK